MRNLVGIALLTLIGTTALSQEAPKAEPPKEIDELRMKLNPDGSHYIKATFLNQVWLRYNDSNPGSTALGEPAGQTVDVGLRRTRLQLYGQLTDHVFFYFQFGQNNFNYLTQNAGNRKIEVFFHDALGEYKIWKSNERLVLGYGLTIANGLSRFSQPSIGTIMSMDVPVFAQATVDQTDEFSRKLSVYARGQLGRFDYRLVMSDPFPVNTNGALPGSSTGGINTTVPIANSSNAAFAQVGHEKQYQGFFMWNFFDKESHVTPYMTGTYLGKKKVLNLEGGFITQARATYTGDGVTNTFHDMNLWSVAAFYDAPLNKDKGTALSAYLGYFHTDYGPGYLRYNGVMNPANGGTPGTTPLSTVSNPANGGAFGNAFPMFGTGQQLYAQLGYLLKKDLLGEGHGTLMPYATVQSASLDRLTGQMTVYDIGINWFLKGHTSKFTLDYQNRPVYSPVGNNLVLSDRKAQIVLQYQIFF